MITDTSFLESRSKTVIGIDLGGTKVVGALFNANGMISPPKKLLVENKTGPEVGQQIQLLIRELMEEAGKKNQAVYAVGVAVPGIYYAKTGKVWAPNINGWDNYPLQSELMNFLNKTGINIKIDSDRACYILGESWKGAAIGCLDAVFLAVGTGIGAGILVNGRVLRGSNDIAGAIGWMAVTSPWIPEYKTFGCFEYHASGVGMAKMASQLISRQSGSSKRTENSALHDLTAKDVFAAYEASDPIAEEVIGESIRFWGKASANLVSLFNPEKIIFGGGVFGPATQFLNEIYKEAQKWAQPISIHMVKFEPSKLGDEAGLYGAGYLALT